MVKLQLANLVDGAFLRSKGRVVIRPFRDGWYAQKWPRPRGQTQHPNSIWTARQWALAARMASYANPLDYATAVAMVKVTDWVPRDILMRAAYGTAYEIYDQDGRQWPVVPKSPPKPRRTPVSAWQWPLWDDAYGGTSSGGAQATKGISIRPLQDIDILDVAAIFTTVAAAQYKVTIAELNATNVIQNVVQSPIMIPSAVTTAPRLFNVQATLRSGVKYAILVTRTDGLSTYVLPLTYRTYSRWLAPIVGQGLCRLATTNPAVGQTLDFFDNTSSWGVGLLASY